MSAATERALARRAGRAQKSRVNQRWFVRELLDRLQADLRTRVETATTMLESRVVQNINVPVKKVVVKRVRDTSGTRTGGPKGSKYTKVTERSQKGEYPRADTTQLLKSIFHDVRETSPGVVEGSVGTPLDYGLFLEISEDLDRRYLTKTLDEMREDIVAIVSQPVS